MQFFVLFALCATVWGILLDPNLDSFYSTPDNIADYKEGDVIDSRPIPGVITSEYLPIHPEGAWQFKVRSQDSFGNPSAIITTVIKPKNGDPSKVLSYQIAQDSDAITCAPSYRIQWGGLNAELQLEMLFVAWALNKGWHVVVPDYEGLKSAFSAGHQAGHAVLDSVKAALGSGDTTGIKSDAEVAFFGYSGGSFASGWASVLQPKYAPEVADNLIGTALGGFYNNIPDTLRVIDGSLYAGLVPLVLQGIFNEYPALLYLLDLDTNIISKTKWVASTALCVPIAAIPWVFRNFFSGLLPFWYDGAGFFARDDVLAVLANQTIAQDQSQGVPQQPIFLFQSKSDQIVPYTSVLKVFNNWKNWGIKSLEFATSTSTGHLLEAFEGVPAAFNWIEGRFNGTAPVEGAVQTVRATNLSIAGSNKQLWQLAVSIINTVLGGDVANAITKYAGNGAPPGFSNLEDFLIHSIEVFANIVPPISIKK